MTEHWSDALAAPPAAHRDPQTRVIHGTELVDPYHWLREKDAPRVRAHLEAENAYTARVMRHTEPLEEELYRRLVERLQETDASVPVRIDDYWYYRRTVAGQQYSIRCRKRGSLEAPEEVLLDLNTLGEGSPGGGQTGHFPGGGQTGHFPGGGQTGHFPGGGQTGHFQALGAFALSPDHRLLAYSLNDDGSERYTLRVLDLESGKPVGEAIGNTSPSVAWANDSRTFFYVVRDAARRPFQAYRHVLGRPITDDELVFHETDERFFVSLSKTRSRRFIVLGAESNVTTEIHVLDADHPADFRPLIERCQGVEVDVDHRPGAFYVLTNRDAVNFKLMKMPDGAQTEDSAPEDWQEVIRHRRDVQLEAVDCFRGHLVVRLRRAGLRQLRIVDLETGEEHEIAFDEPAYTVAAEDNPEFDSQVLRFAYSSLVTPRSVFDYHMATRRRQLKKRTQVLGGFASERYASERIEARAADGARIPISLVYARGLERDGSSPALLTAYGSYGTCNEPRFVASRLNLLERGFVVAIAHVRGGGELGRTWYQDGKLLAKKNTFSDFIAVAEHLISAGYTSSERLAIRGGSAGGMLIGAVLNQRPELFAAAIADVPFVDVLNTMLDHSMPLTVTELEEWGDPRDQRFFEYMRDYSPYDNVAEVRYPHLLITAGLNDPRVQYWEPAKWTARLRELGQGDRRLLLKVDLDSGHGGASGRYDSLRQEAFRQAFLLDSAPEATPATRLSAHLR